MTWQGPETRFPKNVDLSTIQDLAANSDFISGWVQRL
jgi:hypothetical protein